MKKSVLVMLALFLVIPAISNAGSMTSRYDVTFGGFVKYDLGYSTQNAHADPSLAYRHSSSDRAIFADEYSNSYMTGGETRFNFRIKGPRPVGVPKQAPSSKAISAVQRRETSTVAFS